jgi:hypothetical protein
MATIGAGCERETVETVRKDTFAVEKEYKRGPVSLKLKVSHEEITIADLIRLALEVRANEEFEVEFPEFGEQLEQFGIVDYRAPSPQLLEDGVVLFRQSYELEPFLSGDYRIPPMQVRFWKKGEEEGEKHEIESEELTVRVKSLLPEKMAELTIREIVPPVELPAQQRIWLYGAIGGGVLLAIGAAALLTLRRRRTTAEVFLKRPAHELAYEALATLLADNLLEKGEVKAFYLRLSLVLRYYIESRFGLRAPERTTEEFLGDLRITDVLIPTHKTLLEAFLSHCDLVKFAEHQPANDEIQGAFDACKRFIVETEASA